MSAWRGEEGAGKLQSLHSTEITCSSPGFGAEMDVWQSDQGLLRALVLVITAKQRMHKEVFLEVRHLQDLTPGMERRYLAFI